MKTQISILGIILLVMQSLNVFAESIGKQVAEEIGKNYYWEVSRDVKSLKYDEITLKLFTAKAVNEIPLYYIFNVNTKDGFIIVAADDDVIPVLGYSFNGNWDGTEMPEAFSNMFGVFESQISTVIEMQIAGGDEVEALWKKYSVFNPNPSEKSKSVSPLLVTTWNQNQYYNGQCPLDAAGPGGRTYAGCVAVAMAQVMKFYGHPSQGSGSYSYYCPIYGTLSANFGTSNYNYTLMPNSISSSNFQIAQLLYHCGVAVSMNYSAYGSTPGGTYWDTDVTNALKNYFIYSSSTAWDWKVNYNNTAWIAKLKNELDNNRPLIYYGWDGISVAHAFNCDGYQSTNDYFHFNWGWGGMYDGYFPITNLTPASGFNLTYYQGAVFNMTPGQPPATAYDFGDAPTPYPTLTANNGACHAVSAQPTVYMGNCVDTEPDGQPHINCIGDDTDILYPPANDDEDGVTIPLPLYQGSTSGITVIASTIGYLNAWIDYNQNTSWGDAGDQICVNRWLIPGVNVLNINIPANANIGWTYARFRFSSTANLTYTGTAPDGEVEDYFIRINEAIPQGCDFGDAPDSYQTLLASNGANHNYVPTVFLGAGIDIEPDGQPGPMALGDDMNNIDDEDGVAVQLTLLKDAGGWINVTASCTGFLNGWIDQDINGTWNEPFNHVFMDYPLAPGINYIHMPIHPCPNAQIGSTYARFRFSTLPGLSFTGPAPDGEVEDYKMFIYPNSWYWMPNGKPHWITIPASVIPIINGAAISPGDLIGAFYNDDLGYERCAGHVVWTGTSNLNFCINGDNPEIPGKDGFAIGEDIVWKIFSCTDLKSYYAIATYDATYPNADGKFVLNGSSALTDLKAKTYQNIFIEKGWSGVSSCFNPDNDSITSICSGILSNLVILQSSLYAYWPAQNINTLVNWSYDDGYKIKVTSDVTLCMTGTPVTNHTLNYAPGWHIMPVLCENDVPASAVLNVPGFVIAKEIAGSSVYWPAYSINTLNVLKPGKAYMVYFATPAIITFPTNASKVTKNQTEIIYNSPWNEVTKTENSHVIAISDAIAGLFSEGDLMGAFNADGLNVGITEIKTTGNTLVVYGDDAYTSAVDGMPEGEDISFMIYRQATSEMHNLAVVFDTDFADAGSFTTEGLSRMAFTTGIEELNSGAEVNVFPNPAKHQLNIELRGATEGLSEVNISNSIGMNVYNGSLDSNSSIRLDVSGWAEGCYFIRITNEHHTIVKKIVVSK
jgi:hypothetical protein